jgi:hypothetical protein
LLYQKDITQSKFWQASEAQRNISLTVEVVVGYHDPWEAVTEEVIRVACDQKAGPGWADPGHDRSEFLDRIFV